MPKEFCNPVAKLLVCFASYSGRTLEMQLSVQNAIFVAARNGVEIRTEFLARCSMWEQIINWWPTKLMQSDCTDLLIVDDDVSFPADAILRVSRCRRPIVGCVYPYRRDWDKGPKYPALHLIPGVSLDSDGLLEVRSCPMGFVRINRSVFEEMPFEWVRVDGDDEPYRWHFQNRIVDGRYVPADVGFCRQWVERGGRIHVIPDIRMGHTGVKTWRGNLAEDLIADGYQLHGVENVDAFL